MHLLGLGERLAVGAVADDVVGREALSLVQLRGFQHPHADVDDHVGRALSHHRDQGPAVQGCDSATQMFQAAALLIRKPLRLRLDTSDVSFQRFVLNLSV